MGKKPSIFYCQSTSYHHSYMLFEDHVLSSHSEYACDPDEYTLKDADVETACLTFSQTHRQLHATCANIRSRIAIENK